MENEEMERFAEHVELCIAEACGVDSLVTDDDGDWPINVGGAPVYVSVGFEPDPHVHVFSCIATGVSADAWTEINELNKVMAWAKLTWWESGVVIVGQRIHAEAVSTFTIDHALESTAQYFRDCGPLLEVVYGQGPEVPKIAPAEIHALPDNGVFVFGSGKSAVHRGGAARRAYERFGAERGVGEGLRGHSYAIPTMQGIATLEPAVERFLHFADTRPDLDFYLTRVGCGRAGFDESAIASLFADTSANVIKPEGW